MRALGFIAFATALSGLPLSHAKASPEVSIANGTVLGSTSDGVDTFLGIPYAQPPVGQLRFRPPLPLNASFGVFNATETPRACPQLATNMDPRIISQVPPADIAPYLSIAVPPTAAGEDCLTLNVQRPSSSSSAAAKLPVLFWIYGGSFNTGSTQANDFAALVAASEALGHPVLVVQANYRVSAFGFLGGAQVRAQVRAEGRKEGAASAASNVGLRDQRLALQWVAENIAAFGGDPDRVTIWGESAGAVSVLYHMLIDGGNHTYNDRPLFRGAIMNSGSSIPVEPVDGEAAQEVFDAVAEAGGCGAAAAGPDSLECLRGLPYEDLLNATNAAPSLLTHTGIAFSFPPRPDASDSFVSASPEQAIREGRVARVPAVAGNQADEGTFFGLALYNGTTGSALVARHLGPFWRGARRAALEGLVATYPADPAAGSPFGTGDANQLYPGFKRNAAVVGDAVFVMQRRHQLEHTAARAPAWSFLANYRHAAGTLGTGHGTDLVMLASGRPEVPYAHVLQYYVSFVHYLDPNGIAEAEAGVGVGTGRRRALTPWPRWTPEDRRMIQLNADGESVIRDDFRAQSYEYFKGIISELKV